MQEKGYLNIMLGCLSRPSHGDLGNLFEWKHMIVLIKHIFEKGYLSRLKARKLLRELSWVVPMLAKGEIGIPISPERRTSGLSWLERTVHIRKVGGSSPSLPIGTTRGVTVLTRHGSAAKFSDSKGRSETKVSVDGCEYA